MYAVEAVSTQGNAKSCIQALLKTRENHQISVKPLHKSSSKDSSALNHCSSYPDQEIGLQNLELASKVQTSSDYIPYEATSPENLDYQKDFNYSQKLFHIADGNLYSIFSPIQGRSYGMKPSFLRKQKYTVQECHSRGRKTLRKGLKFHNFLPSESVTSEKDNGYFRSKWKVHSECRLREEHGTKQITISNWSQSVQNPNNETSDCNSKVSKCDSSSTSVTAESAHQSSFYNCNETDKIICKSKSDDDFDPYDFNLSLQSNSSPENSNVFSAVSKESKDLNKNFLASTNLKKDSLSLVLNSLMDKPVSENKSLNCDKKSSFQSLCQNQTHRRKPVQTRRIVPYVKYLSILEENESLPLDLSSKCENSLNLSISSEESQNISGKNVYTYGNVDSLVNNDMILKTVSEASNSNTSLSVSSVSNSVPNPTVNNVLQTQIAAPLAFICPLPVGKSIAAARHAWPQPDRKDHQDFIGDNYVTANHLKSSVAVSVENSINTLNQSLINGIQYHMHKPIVKETHSKARRRNQRSVIKQKLEDTFRQNGFLVKTKQVSDGEATFCKFRQLRKYTRYYLKSWQQHLPDEVNKMWKGFLPPKTVLPPVSGTSETTNGALL